MPDYRFLTPGLLLLGLTACATTDQPAGDLEIVDGEQQPDEPEVNEPAEQCGERSAPTATDEELALNTQGELELGTALLTELSGQHDNVLLSPYSLRSAFGQVYAGTQGTSRGEIEAVLGFADLGERTHAVLNSVSQQLESRNAEATEFSPQLIVRPVNRSFFDVAYEDSVGELWLETVQSHYGTCTEVFDMNADHEATKKYVNDWVSAQTGDLIPNLVKSLPESVSLILVNALYFKAAWATPFSESLTHKASFLARSGGEVEVDMMHAPLHQGSYAEHEQWQAVSLPYSDGRLEMVVVLPAEGSEEDFAASLDAGQLQDVFDALEYTTVDLQLPKFDLMSSWGLRSTFQTMGMSAAFENAGDFSPIAEGMMPIFEIFHDVAIIIDEKGTEAAAATAVVFGEDGGEDPVAEAQVVADRTFYVAIRDRSAGAVMFFARVGDPTAR